MVNLATVGTDLTSQVWGFGTYSVTQEFGVKGFRPDWYAYSADYGWPAGYHIGLDVNVPKGTPIYANEAGTVIQSGFSDSFRPNPVWVKEDDGDTAIYGHLWSDNVATGDRVKRGQLVGFSGEQTFIGTMTPDGSGPHLHYELRNSAGVAVDPTAELLEKADGDESWRATSLRPGQNADSSDGGGFSLLPDIDWKQFSLRGGAVIGGIAVLFIAVLSMKSGVIKGALKGVT